MTSWFSSTAPRCHYDSQRVNRRTRTRRIDRVARDVWLDCLHDQFEGFNEYEYRFASWYLCRDKQPVDSDTSTFLSLSLSIRLWCMRIDCYIYGLTTNFVNHPRVNENTNIKRVCYFTFLLIAIAYTEEEQNGSTKSAILVRDLRRVSLLISIYLLFARVQIFGFFTLPRQENDTEGIYRALRSRKCFAKPFPSRLLVKGGY